MTASAHPCDTTDDARGLMLGLAGVALFSLTLPFTRLAVLELDPMFVAFGRALGAAALAAACLVWRRAPLPPRAALLPLALVAVGVVIAYPLLTSIALRSLPAAHGAVLAGALPLATALYVALRGDERPSSGFWLVALLGAALVVAYAVVRGGGSLHRADLLMLLAIGAGAMGYAEGGKLARTLGGPETMCWALLVAAAPAIALLAWHYAAQPRALLDELTHASATAWLAMGYVTACSSLLGMFLWYRGMALGGVARVGQVQLLQPFMSLIAAAALLGEALDLATCLFAIAVLAVVFAGRRMQVRR